MVETAFQENLEHDKVDAAIKALKKCDLLIIGGTSTATMKKALKSVAPAGYATEYIKRGSFKLTNKSDTFLFKNVTRVAIPKSSSGSSSHRSSSGVSHGGGGRHI